MKVRQVTFHGSLLVVLLCCFSWATWAQTYKVTDLGVLNSTGVSEAYAISASGEVVGYATPPSGVSGGAFVYNNGKMTNLGTLGGTISLAQGINASGQVVGYSTLTTKSYGAFLYSGGVMTNIGTLGGTYAAAYAINGSGEIVGVSTTAAGAQHPFLYSGGKMTDLGTLGSTTASWTNEATAVNSLGATVGYSYLANGNFHAFLYSNGVIKDLGTLGGDWSEGYAINDSGEITGIAYTKGNVAGHAFLYSNGAMKDLGTINKGPYTWGFGINTSGVVVGQVDLNGPDGNLLYHAFIYSGGKMQDLNALIPANSGWVLSKAAAINDAGQIVGYGTVKNEEHAFLLTPNP
jgi:probable HAF family extracellular repeat protein